MDRVPASMDVEKSSLCNCVVNFLLDENYLLSAFELLHELLDDGRDDHAIRLKSFFSDPDRFPPDLISRFNALRVADPQSLLEEKESLEKKLAISEYDLRLAQEDVLRLKSELQRQTEFPYDKPNGSDASFSANDNYIVRHRNKDGALVNLGPLKDNERRDLNCAVKEYLLLAGYRLTAMTFYEEVTDQNIDVWQNSPACVPDAMRRYYYEYLSSTAEAAEEKISAFREIEALTKANDKLKSEQELLLKCKNSAENKIDSLTKSLQASEKDLKERENLVQSLLQTIEQQRKQLKDYRAEVTSLKMLVNRPQSTQVEVSGDEEYLEQAHVEIESVQIGMESAEINNSCGDGAAESADHEDNNTLKNFQDLSEVQSNRVTNLSMRTENDLQFALPNYRDDEKVLDSYNQVSLEEDDANGKHVVGEKSTEDYLKGGTASECVEHGLETIQILSDALPKIVPYVLINHREELLPLIMCAIERHPSTSIRDSLTHTLFNLIKRPDEQQRRIIMDACVTLAKNVGEMRTETELLPQCWEQINHLYEERRLLVAQSCGELADFVRPEIRDSLILSILQQLVEDSATVVREAAAHNLALLLPLFPNMDKYIKVEELMFQLVCDPSGVVVETSLKELVPVVLNWCDNLDHILHVTLSNILKSAQRCPPLSGVEGSMESHLRVLGEQERWNIDALLRMLVELLPVVYQNAIKTCPFNSLSDPVDVEFVFSTSLLELYARGDVAWPLFDWIHVDCFPSLIELACVLPQKEDNLRNRITKFLLAVSKLFGDHYLTHIMLPVFLVAVGDTVDLTMFPLSIAPRVRGLQPKTASAKRLSVMCVLPLLFAGILGGKSDQLGEYLRKVLIKNNISEGSSSTYQTADLIDAVHFLCTFEEHHGIIFNILWEMVVSSNTDLKIRAANLLKVLVPYVDEKVASTQVLPALVTLGSDQNLNVKYASIDAFGAVAQHFKNNMIVDKIRVQMDAFLEDGSHEATIAVIRSLVVAVPSSTERLRDYILSKIFQLTSLSPQGIDIIRRRERANAVCESIRALDATDLPAASVREYLLPTINNLLKDPDALDPAHKEALEIIMRERSGGTFENITKVMGSHLGIASSMSSLFSEGGLLGKKETADNPPDTIAVSSTLPASPHALAEDTRFRRIMRGNFGDMLRGRGKIQEENP